VVEVASELNRLTAEVSRCTACVLSRTRLKAVPGEGPADARILFIGEGPGWNENKTGRPFVGAAGQFLEQLLASIGMRREEVYITNVVKCWPPENRDPLPEEIAACSGFLERQLALLNPQLIVTLGRYSMARFFPGESISRIHGQARRCEGRLVMPMFHPAAALHQPKYKADIEADFKKIPAILAQTIPPEETPPTPEQPVAEQLSLF